MKAAVYYGPGDVRIEDVREPGPPGPEEVVLQVKMGSLCGTDASQYKAATIVPLQSPHRSTLSLTLFWSGLWRGGAEVTDTLTSE